MYNKFPNEAKLTPKINHIRKTRTTIIRLLGEHKITEMRIKIHE